MYITHSPSIRLPTRQPVDNQDIDAPLRTEFLRFQGLFAMVGLET
jgi:hypothetical protein